MSHESLSSRSDQQWLAVWIRGCVLASGVALLGLAVMLGSMVWTHRRPPLEVLPPRINPNTASMASLVRLPGVGKARAMDIIHYRKSQEQDGPVFRSAQDLESICGIGPKTAAKLEPWLVFEDDLTTNELK